MSMVDTLVSMSTIAFLTGVAQLVEQWSPKPKVEGSIPSARAPKEQNEQDSRIL